MTIRSDVDLSIRHAIGDGQYSAFINDAAILALQSRGIADWLVEFEREHGDLSDEELKAARERLAGATIPRKR